MIEWVFSWVDRFMQSFIWKSILANFRWVDWMTALIIILGIIYGIRKGLMREIVEILEAVFILFIVFAYYKKFAFFITQYFSFVAGHYAPPVAFILFSLIMWFVISYLDEKLIKLFHTKTVGPVRVIGGALLGCFHLFLLWSFVSQPLIMMPLHKVRRVYEDGNSYTGPKVRMFAPRVYVTLKQAINFWKKTA